MIGVSVALHSNLFKSLNGYEKCFLIKERGPIIGSYCFPTGNVSMALWYDCRIEYIWADLKNVTYCCIVDFHSSFRKFFSLWWISTIEWLWSIPFLQWLLRYELHECSNHDIFIQHWFNHDGNDYKAPLKFNWLRLHPPLESNNGSGKPDVNYT